MNHGIAHLVKQLPPQEQFKVAFLEKCAEDGLTAPEILEKVKKAQDMVKQGFISKLLAGLGGAASGAGQFRLWGSDSGRPGCLGMGGPLRRSLPPCGADPGWVGVGAGQALRCSPVGIAGQLDHQLTPAAGGYGRHTGPHHLAIDLDFTGPAAAPEAACGDQPAG
jgi:hypothetical protein